MDMAVVASKYSEATRLHVGAVIVKGDQILSVGINGTPEGWETNICESVDGDGVIYTKPEVEHGEASAIQKLTRCTVSSVGATLFCTHSPCFNCAKLIAGAGITTVYYIHDFRCTSGIEYLKKRNVEIHKLENYKFGV